MEEAQDNPGRVDGRKTYIIAAVVIGLVVTEAVFGIDVPGFETGDDAVGLILAALGLGAVRHGVAKQNA